METIKSKNSIPWKHFKYKEKAILITLGAKISHKLSTIQAVKHVYYKWRKENPQFKLSDCLNPLSVAFNFFVI